MAVDRKVWAPERPSCLHTLPGPAALCPGFPRLQAALGGAREPGQHVPAPCGAEGKMLPTPGSFPQGAGAPCVAEEGQPGMNGDLVSRTSLEPGATTQGLFTSNLATEAALSLTGGSRADMVSGGRVASVAQHCCLSCPYLAGVGWELQRSSLGGEDAESHTVIV